MENDYIKREDALEIVADWNEYDEDYQNENCMAERLRRLPAAEVVPIGEEYECGYTDGQMAEQRAIVRCKECRYVDTCCKNVIPDYNFAGFYEEIDYCSYGKRKDGDK